MRKNHVINEMLKVRNDYEKLFLEIEGPDSEAVIEWPKPSSTVLCYPRFVSKKRNGKSSHHHQKTSVNEPPKNGIAELKKVTNSPTKENTKPTRIEKHFSQPPPCAISNEIAVFGGTSKRFENSEKAKFECDLDDEKIKFLQLDNLKSMEKNDLLSVRESVSLELLWIQQAIQSRVQVFNNYKF